jgi:Lon protease-like protein
MSDSDSPLENFEGPARLFPLPNLVFFPGAMQPLHIFEPRYRQMTADALAGDRLITVVRLKQDWEKDYEGRPAIHQIGCLGLIVADQRQDDGRYNLLLRGISRVRVQREMATEKLYRLAEIGLLHEAGPSTLVESKLRRKLKERMRPWLTKDGAAFKQLAGILADDISLGDLVDILTFMLPLDTDFKQRQLEETRVQVRVENLLTQIPEAKPASKSSTRTYPPDFSAN